MLLSLAGCGEGTGSAGPPPTALQPPGALSYSDNYPVYPVGQAIGPNWPSSSGGAVTAYSVSPALPAGLALDATSGILGGTPTTISATAAYTVTASNAAGSTTVTLTITVRAAGTWRQTSAMGTSRGFHTATLLANGKVLVAGGHDILGTAFTRAEIYDPSSGTSAFSGAMYAPRSSHTATLLPDGKVLVAGGVVGGYGSAIAELYDPATGTWTATGGMGTARYDHTATLLLSGRVLVAGGRGASNPNAITASAEVYDPTSGTWTSVGSMGTTRARHAEARLASGKVLVSGGEYSSSSAEVFDPASGTWAPVGIMGAARMDHGSVLLSSGRVLVLGGVRAGAPVAQELASAELFDPTTGTFTATGSMGHGRACTPVVLPGGQVLAASGNELHGANETAEIYDPETGRFAPTDAPRSGRFSAARATLLADGRVLLTGGYFAATEVFSVP